MPRKGCGKGPGCSVGEHEENRRAEVNVLREVHCHVEDEGKGSKGSGEAGSARNAGSDQGRASAGKEARGEGR